MNDMKPKSFPIGVIFIIMGVVLIGIGALSWKIIGSEKYVKTESISESFDGTQVTDISLNIQTGKFVLEATDSNEIRIEGKNIPEGVYEISCTDNEFSVTVKKLKWYEWYKNVNFSINGVKNTAEITVYIPNKEYQQLNIDMGAGECTIREVSCIDADIDCGVGENSFNDCTFNQLDLDCGVGDVNFSGKITGSLDFDGGVGNCTVRIDGYRNDYEIDSDSGIGKINISGSSESGKISGEKIPIKLSCGVGNLDLIFN